MSFNFQYETESHSQRQSYRVSYQGLEALIVSSGIKTKVANLSSTGIALEIFSDEIKENDILSVSLLLENNILLANIKIKVVFVNYAMKFIGCEYYEFTKNQGKKIDILILKLQKLEINKKKAILKKAEKENAVKQALANKDFERTGISIYENGQNDKSDGDKVNIYTQQERKVIKDENAVNIFSADNPHQDGEDTEIVSISKWKK